MTQLPTPRMVIDAATVRRNVERMGKYVSGHGIGLRPHTKTHKSQRMARMQLDAGAIGLTAAKLGEARIMSEVSDDILLAYPAVDPVRSEGIARLAASVTVHVAIDSHRAADVLASAAQAARTTVGILVDVDVGMGRTGLQTAEQALELAQQVDASTGLRLDGIMCYPGHVWRPAEEQGASLAAVSTKVRAVIDLWGEHGLSADIVSGGSTPTAYQSHLIPELTEIRPGTYIYNDMNTVHGGFCTLDDCAARIICTVISDAVPGQVVIDAGSKTLTSDRCLPAPDSGFGYVVEYPTAKIVALSEEHGQVDVSRCDSPPSVGDTLTVIPNHICPCINLQDAVYLNNGEGELESVNVDARGKLV